MHKREPVPEVKLFYAVLYSDDSVLDQVKSILSEKWGRIDFISPSFDFDKTDYYFPEMGGGLKRIFMSFEQTVTPEALIDAKLFSDKAEEELSDCGRRLANLDPGYIDCAKLVLASFKGASHKIYIDKGIYADLTLRYSKGRFEPFGWTFPDFKDESYYPCLLKIRNIYKEQIKHVR